MLSCSVFFTRLVTCIVTLVGLLWITATACPFAPSTLTFKLQSIDSGFTLLTSLIVFNFTDRLYRFHFHFVEKEKLSLMLRHRNRSQQNNFWQFYRFLPAFTKCRRLLSYAARDYRKWEDDRERLGQQSGEMQKAGISDTMQGDNDR